MPTQTSVVTGVVQAIFFLLENASVERGEQAANIADLVNSSGELFFRAGALRYALGRRYGDGYRVEYASAKLAVRPAVDATSTLITSQTFPLDSMRGTL